MGDVILLYCIQNVFLFTSIFWLLTFLGEYFYKYKDNKTKQEFYECGFQSLHDSDIQFNLNFSILCVFLILYDVEFSLLIPILFNLQNLWLFGYFILILFIILIILSLQYDWQMNALNWQY